MASCTFPVFRSTAPPRLVAIPQPAAPVARTAWGWQAFTFTVSATRTAVLSFLSSSFAWDDCTPAGELELVVNDGVTVECALILMSEWKTKLPDFLKDDAR